jgi:hypothetical protein
VILAGLAAVAALLRMAALTGRTDDVANDERWAELTGNPVPGRPAPTGLLPGLAAGARRISGFTTGRRES